MRLVKVDHVPQNGVRKGDLFAILDEFMKSENSACRVEGYAHTNVRGAYSAFKRAVKKYGYRIRVSVRGGELYLSREDGEGHV